MNTGCEKGFPTLSSGPHATAVGYNHNPYGTRVFAPTLWIRQNQEYFHAFGETHTYIAPSTTFCGAHFLNSVSPSHAEFQVGAYHNVEPFQTDVRDNLPVSQENNFTSPIYTDRLSTQTRHSVQQDEHVHLHPTHIDNSVGPHPRLCPHSTLTLVRDLSLPLCTSHCATPQFWLPSRTLDIRCS